MTLLFRTRRLSLFLVVLFSFYSFASDLKYQTVVRSVVEARLRAVSSDNTERELTLKKMFAEVGCSHLSEQKVAHVAQPNLICLLPGQTDSTIIVGAHFDHVEKGEGVVDNWSGASLLPSLFQGLESQPLQHTYIFIAFAGEEKGELGSAAYVDKMTREDVARTAGMVNMDTLGLAPTEVWLSRADHRMAAALYALAAKIHLPVSAVNVDNVGSSDSEQFARKKIPRITIHSVTQKTWPILHSTRDRLDAVQLDDYYNSYRLLQAYVVLLDQVLVPVPQSAGH
jgi:putative aminopeptidase FrvX